MLTLLSTYGPPLVGLLALLFAGWRTSTSSVWRGEAEAWKERANRLIGELEQVKTKLEELEGYTQTLVRLLSTIDPEKLNELRNRGH
jgi:hypothetical protein